jgi:hypothetical protein
MKRKKVFSLLCLKNIAKMFKNFKIFFNFFIAEVPKKIKKKNDVPQLKRQNAKPI